MKEISITSFDNLQIGQAENAAAGTGCTVFLLGKDGAPAGLDVRGGGPASRESELLKPLAAAQVIHGIVLAGGSAFGLDAAGGVMRYLEERNIGYDVGVTKVPLVCQADLFDLTVADARTRPDAAMAYQACANAENNFGMDPAKLVVSEVFATPGPILKRMMPRAQGRAYRINKKTSHVTLAVTEKA